MNQITMGWYGRPAKLESVLDHVGVGWHPLVRTLIVDLFAAGWDGQLTQIKEKFGGLRFYIGSGSEEVHALTRKAEDDSFRICEQCGDAGECRYDLGWYKTLCDKHYHEIIDMPAPTSDTEHAPTS